MTSRTPRRRAGRPSAEQARDARTALLNAARELFSARSFRAVTVRELAAAAGVNPAMVNYHFGGKEGIYEAMVADAVGPMVAQLEQAGDDSGALTLDRFLERYQATLVTHPWLPNLVVREVLYSEGRFRDTFIQQFAARAARGLAALIEQERDTGNLRPDLDPRLAAVSLLSLTVFPLIARPLLERALELTMDDALLHRLSQHNRRLFRDGAQTEPGDGPKP